MAFQPEKRKILLLDDDRNIRKLYSAFLGSKGFHVDEAETITSALEYLESNRPDIAVFDFQLPDGTALGLLEKMGEMGATFPVIILTGFGSMELGVTLIKHGAEQCISKPIDAPELLVIVNKVLENSRNSQKELASKSKTKRISLDPFLGESNAIKRLVETAVKVAMSQSPVLIQGETGTGKGVLANWFHANSTRADEPFVDLNCAGLSREFLESELFGYEKGAFTGAVKSKLGLLEVGHHGTVFLDEIGDIDQNVQPKLLKVVEEKRFRRMGDVRDRIVDVRLIAATHQDLQKLIENHTFRSDLYFRISTIPILIPPLRERPEDIPAIAHDLLRQICTDMAKPQVQLTSSAMQRLHAYHWPGNIRELRNVLERALIMKDGPILGPEDLLFDAKVDHRSNSYDANWTLEELERNHIQFVLKNEEGNVEKTAKRLGIAKSTLYQKLKSLNMN